MIPKVIHIGPHPYTVVVDEERINKESVEAKTRLLGYCDSERSEMILRPGQSDSQQKDTILHEVLHAITHQTGIQHELGDDDEEKMVVRMTPLLLLVLQSNWDLVEYLAIRSEVLHSPPPMS